MKKTLIISALAGLCFCVTAQAQGPVVSTDKADYAPGETVQITAAGFQPLELVDFSIAVGDDNGLWVPDIGWADIPADASGGASVDYVVPETWAGKTLQLTAMGVTSGLMATTTFTDVSAANINFATSGLPSGISITITGTGVNNGGNQQSINVTFNSPGPSDDTGVKPFSSFTYAGFPATVPGAGGHYAIDHYSQTSPATAGAGAPSAATTVTAFYTFIPDVVNNPPVITCSNLDVDLGQVVGCLGIGTGFGQTFPVSYAVVAGTGNEKIVQATFTKPDGTKETVNVASVTDADAGDTITVTLANGTNPVTISGPGNGSAPFSVDITANDGHAPDVNATCGHNANAQIIYNFTGFFPPLNNNAATKVKRGSGVPVKFQLSDGCGNAITTGTHHIDVVYASGAAPSGDPTVDDAGMSGDNGDLFRYDTLGQQWIFNLKTDMSYYVGNSYYIIANLDDGTSHQVLISIK